MENHIKALMEYLKFEKVEDNLYKIEDDDNVKNYYIGTEEEIQKIYIREILTRDEWVSAVEEGNTDVGYVDWVEELKGDYSELNVQDGSFETFNIEGEKILVMLQQIT